MTNIMAGLSQTSSENGRRKRRFWPLLLIFLIAGGVGGGRYYVRHVLPFESTDNAFVEATVVRINPEIPGRVLKVHVSDNQTVKAGDLLVEIDPKPFQVKRDAAQASLHMAESKLKTAQVSVGLTKASTDAGIEQAQAEVEAARAAVEQSRAEVTAAEAESKRAETDLTRYGHLDGSAISKQRYDVAEATASVSGARLSEAHKQVIAAEARVGAALGKLAAAKTAPQQIEVSESEVDQAQAGVEQARAALDAAELELSYASIVAPASGQIAKKSVHEGEMVQPGQALMALVKGDTHVIANFKETQLTHMRVGQPVSIEVDAFPRSEIKGHVDSIQQGTGARFSLLPPENATGNYVKVVQRVPVKIVLDEAPPSDMILAPGMSVVPKVRVQ